MAHRENAIFALASDINEYRAISRRFFKKYDAQNHTISLNIAQYRMRDKHRPILRNIAQYRMQNRRDIHEYRRDIRISP